MAEKNKPLKIMMIAGEDSGDILAAEVMAELNRKNPKIQFMGVGGLHMQKQGLKSTFPMEELSLMGLVEVLPHLRQLFKRRDELVALAVAKQPDVLLTVDAPDFTLRVAKQIKAKTGIPCLHYVSPSLWAWRQGRAQKMAQFLDHIFLLFPFEEKYYTPHKLASTFVGHPVVQRLGHLKNKPHEKQISLALLPGSRAGELNRLFPAMLAAFKLLQKIMPQLKAVVPAPNPKIEALAKELAAGHKNIQFVAHEKRWEALAKCHAAVATSGTANLELAVLGLPMVVVYKMAPVSYFLAKLLVKIPYISPTNWVAGKKVVPELVQKEATAENMLELVLPLLGTTQTRKTQTEELGVVKKKLEKKGKSSGELVAAKILEICQ